MFPMWYPEHAPSDERTARLRDLETRMDSYLAQKRGRASGDLVRAVTEAREQLRRTIVEEANAARQPVEVSAPCAPDRRSA